MMEFVKEIPDDAIGIGINMNTNEAFLSVMGKLIPLPEEKLNELVVSLMYIMEVQETSKIARYN